MKKSQVKPKRVKVNPHTKDLVVGVNIKDGDLKTEAYLDYDAFTGKGLIQVATEHLTFSLDAPAGGKDGLLAALKNMSDKKRKTIFTYKANIEVCFFPSLAKKLLRWLESEMAAKT